MPHVRIVMPPAADAQQQISTFAWLLRSGGVWPLGLGMLLAVVGIVLVFKRSITATKILGFASLLPAIIGLICVYMAADDFGELASSERPFKPNDLARIVGRGMSYGFFGLLGTILSMFFAAVAFARHNCSVEENTSGDMESE
ncbi:MAG: hypothetical protein R3C01_09900 [Planctomycetaceae bacterium]